MVLQILLLSIILTYSENLFPFPTFIISDIILDENYHSLSKSYNTFIKSITHNKPIAIKKVVDLVQHPLQHCWLWQVVFYFSHCPII